MPDFVKGLLTVLLCIALGAGTMYLVGSLLDSDPSAWAWTGAIFGLLYGLEAGILTIYDLGSPLGWFLLLLDMTWSLPNTIFGFVFGNVIYLLMGSTPSRADSRHQSWISYPGGIGKNAAQTLGTVNLGGPGKHERVHLMQARLFGPLYLPIYGLSYAVTFVIQCLWSITIGGLLALLDIRDTAYFRPPSKSVVQGFWGWIYYATLFELWAYSTHN